MIDTHELKTVIEKDQISDFGIGILERVASIKHAMIARNAEYFLQFMILDLREDKSENGIHVEIDGLNCLI